MGAAGGTLVSGARDGTGALGLTATPGAPDTRGGAAGAGVTGALGIGVTPGVGGAAGAACGRTGSERPSAGVAAPERAARSRLAAASGD
jgi:hypothetical protein